MARLAVTLALLCGCAIAQKQADDPVEPLRRAILSSEWPEAEALLPELRNRAEVDSTEIEFLTGLLAASQGQYDRAIAAFRGILAQRPDLVRVRLELARALYLKGDDEASRYHFKLVLAGDIPDAVAANINKFLDAIRRRQDWTFDVGFGLFPDSNINAATSQQVVYIGGLPFTLSSDAQQTSGFGALISLSGSKTLPISSDWRLRGFASGVRRDYSNSRFDDMTLRAGLGPRRLFSAGEVGVAPIGSLRWFGNDLYTRSGGIRIDGNWQLSDQQALESVVEHQSNYYPTDSRLDGHATWIFAGLHQAISPYSQVLLALDFFKQQTAEPTLQNDGPGLTLGYYRDWGHGISTGAAARISGTHYDGIQPLFGQQRDDVLGSLTLSATKRDWAIADFVPTASLIYLRNDSSIPFFSYERTQFLVGFDRRL